MTRQKLPQARIDAAIKSLFHRGPDGHGTWTSSDGRMLLGHTRLSIIGLNNGAQPMTSPDGRVHTVVNGEFYGYRKIRDELRAKGCRFSTDSDSEIALHLYQQVGTNAATQLRGEFAVVIADEREGTMVAIRDRFGIKPLYYSVVNGEVFFASEIKTLLALGVPSRWDFEGAYGVMICPHEKTLFAGVNAVPPGCFAIAKDGDVRIYPYWDWEFPTAKQLRADTRTEAEVVQEFRSVLQDAVRERLVADVEVASYLSGGIDSCAVLGLAQQMMDRPIRAFTLTFDHTLYNEAEIAEKQAKLVGSSYHPIPITGREIADHYADAVWHSETPMTNGHGVAKYLLSRAVRDAGIKVVFTGEGADEMTGGYAFFRVDAVNHNPALSAAQKNAYFAEIFGANEATRSIFLPDVAPDQFTASIERRLGWLPATVTPIVALMQKSAGIYKQSFRAAVNGYNPIAAALDRIPIAMRLAERDHLNQMLYLWTRTALPNFILCYLGDRMEMAHSIEGRVPFLDHHLAETAAKIPVDMKVKGIREKHVLREAAKDVLVPEVYDRQKHPFTSPPTSRQDDPMLAFYRDTFASQAAKTQPIVDMQAANAALDVYLQSEPEQRIAIEGGLQRIASLIVMQEKFRLT